ncbi:MAG: hypothetical protein ACRCX2_23200 [Paraclostridium sp.]
MIDRMNELIKELENIKYDNLNMYKKEVDAIRKIIEDGDKALCGKYKAMEIIKRMEYITKNRV